MLEKKNGHANHARLSIFILKKKIKRSTSDLVKEAKKDVKKAPGANHERR